MAQGGHGLIFIQKPRLLVVDYFRNYPEVCLLNDTHSSSVIVKLKSIFSHFGIPKVVISDYGPQFSSYQFIRFAKEWDFTQDPSSPKHAKSNSMAESAVKTVKGLFNKGHRNKEDPYLALIAHRSTPSSNDNKSPYEKLFNQPMRTLLPDFRKLKRKSTQQMICQLNLTQSLQRGRSTIMINQPKN